MEKIQRERRKNEDEPQVNIERNIVRKKKVCIRNMLKILTRNTTLTLLFFKSVSTVQVQCRIRIWSLLSETGPSDRDPAGSGSAKRWKKLT